MPASATPSEKGFDIVVHPLATHTDERRTLQVRNPPAPEQPRQPMDRISVADFDQVGPFVAKYSPQFPVKRRQISGRHQQAIAFVEQKSPPRRDVIDAPAPSDLFDLVAFAGHD